MYTQYIPELRCEIPILSSHFMFDVAMNIEHVKINVAVSTLDINVSYIEVYQ